MPAVFRVGENEDISEVVDTTALKKVDGCTTEEDTGPSKNCRRSPELGRKQNMTEDGDTIYLQIPEEHEEAYGKRQDTIVSLKTPFAPFECTIRWHYQHPRHTIEDIGDFLVKKDLPEHLKQQLPTYIREMGFQRRVCKQCKHRRFQCNGLIPCTRCSASSFECVYLSGCEIQSTIPSADAIGNSNDDKQGPASHERKSDDMTMI